MHAIIMISCKGACLALVSADSMQW